MPHKNPEDARAYRKQYYIKNRAILLAKSKTYREENPKKVAEANRRWRLANPEKHCARQMRYYRRHPKKLQAKNATWIKQNYERYLEKARARSCRWAKENPIAASAKCHRRKASKLGGGGKWTPAQWNCLKIKTGNICLCCKKTENEIHKLDRILVPDHVIPLSLGGHNNIENIQPLCHGRGGCNNRKGTKHVDYRGRL